MCVCEICTHLENAPRKLQSHILHEFCITNRLLSVVSSEVVTAGRVAAAAADDDEDSDSKSNNGKLKTANQR